MTRMRTAVMTVGALGGLSGAVWGLLLRQSRHARVVIGRPTAPPLNADGTYLPSGAGPVDIPDADPLRFAVLGDSSAAGLGADSVAELPGVALARGLAEEAARPVRLTTFARVGATTLALADQVDQVLAPAPSPEVCLVIIGANDVSTRLRVATSAELLGEQVGRLRRAGVRVVVGTCPDLGAVRPIPQPLRSVARRWSTALARQQHLAVLRAGGYPVPLGDLLSSEFLARPRDFFSADQFHPNAAGYDAAVSILLPPLCQVAGVWGGPLPELTRRDGINGRGPRRGRRMVGVVNRMARRLLDDGAYLSRTR